MTASKEETVETDCASPGGAAGGNSSERIVVREDILDSPLANEIEAEVSARLIALLESERGKIAREIHDEAGQLLISAAFRLDQAIALLPRAFVARDLVEQARQALNVCAETLHGLAFNLRPRMLDDLGLLPALESYLKRYANLTGVELQVGLEQSLLKLSPAAELVIFRIVQEAVANIRKHARATKVRVRLRFINQIAELEVSDNGVGFEPCEAGSEHGSRPTLGLEGMRERAMSLGGELQVESKRFLGTTIRAKIPIGDARYDRPA